MHTIIYRNAKGNLATEKHINHRFALTLIYSSIITLAYVSIALFIQYETNISPLIKVNRPCTSTVHTQCTFQPVHLSK